MELDGNSTRLSKDKFHDLGIEGYISFENDKIYLSEEKEVNPGPYPKYLYEGSIFNLRLIRYGDKLCDFDSYINHRA